ncbi:MAG: quinone oxidoreductase [Geodermatophilaceae bacterium]|nr:quinone oxidoreductase [Geodermatophilaceae bacterium]
MRAIQVTEHGRPEVLALIDVATPEAGGGQLLVDIAAAGLNYIDTYQRSGSYPIETPFILGQEGAGTVRSVGPGVDGFSVGDRVAWKNCLGSYAETVAIPAAEAVPVPDGVEDEVAAAAMLQGLTAQYLATSTYPIQGGDWVVVHAAAGGVGHLLTQIVKLRGGHVLATTSTSEKAALATAAGADRVVTYDEMIDAAMEVTGGVGVAAVYDGVGASTFDDSLAALRIRGTMALFGAASGPVPPLDPQRLNSGGGLFLTRPSLVHYTRDRDELIGRTDEVFGWIADGSLRVQVGHRYPLAEAARAHTDLEARKTTAKSLLIP